MLAAMIYLDNQATTPLAPEAREAMLRWLGGPGTDGFGNPHSPHRLGRLAHAAVEAAREQVAALLPSGGQVIFTSGATEAINLAMRGLPGSGPIAFSAIEHSAVSHTARALGPVHELPVTRDGICEADQPLAPSTRLVAVMQVNNEIGTIQPVAEWHRRAGAAGALLLCDGVQAYGKLPLASADLIAVSAHKIYGPKGIGALWVRDGAMLECVSTGGAQEGGLRSGTLSPALIAGFGAAAALAAQRMEADRAHLAGLWARARELFGGWELNGSAVHRWPGNLNLRLPKERGVLDVGRLISDCRQVMFSAGSACASEDGQPSHVLSAIGLDAADAKASIRLGLGRYTTISELEVAAETIINAASQQG